MIILRTSKGWTAPKKVEEHYIEGYWRSHQVPLADVRENEKHLRILEEWLKSYEPERLFDEKGRLREDLRSLAPKTTSPGAVCPGCSRTIQASLREHKTLGHLFEGDYEEQSQQF
jgi:phosphoketolase